MLISVATPRLQMVSNSKWDIRVGHHFLQLATMRRFSVYAGRDHHGCVWIVVCNMTSSSSLDPSYIRMMVTPLFLSFYSYYERLAVDWWNWFRVEPLFTPCFHQFRLSRGSVPTYPTYPSYLGADTMLSSLRSRNRIES